ncbi:hypothetical protein [Streptomyces sp. TM32]|nr:hypothetical protein [Streptomyces sp. TM32]
MPAKTNAARWTMNRDIRIDPEDGTPCQWAEHEAFDAPSRWSAAD